VGDPGFAGALLNIGWVARLTIVTHTRNSILNIFPVLFTPQASNSCKTPRKVVETTIRLDANRLSDCAHIPRKMAEIASLPMKPVETGSRRGGYRRGRGGGRTSGRPTRKPSSEVEPPRKGRPKAAVKPEKKVFKVKPEFRNGETVETVVTEHGHVIHQNGLCLGRVNADVDHIYLISEPPGEPYYIARVMEFIYMDPHSTQPEHTDYPVSNTTGRKVKAVRVNWLYRPRDISHKHHSDTRCLYATMHSDVNPISAVRAVCTVRHRSEIPNREFEAYKRADNQFWFSRLHDRYIQRNYDVVPTSEITNVPDRVGEVLREKWKFVVVESTAKKELCQEPRRCAKCTEWCRRYCPLSRLC
jgi:BAH domain